MSWAIVILICGVGFEKDSPDVVVDDVGLISLGCDDEGEGKGDGFDVIWPGWIVNGWFIPPSRTQ